MGQDEYAFFADYAASHKKLSELGFRGNTICSSLFARSAVGVAVAATVVILGYCYELNRRLK